MTMYENDGNHNNYSFNHSSIRHVRVFNTKQLPNISLLLIGRRAAYYSVSSARKKKDAKRSEGALETLEGGEDWRGSLINGRRLKISPNPSLSTRNRTTPHIAAIGH